MPKKYESKVEGNVLYWFNEKKWLVKETFQTEEAAIKKLEELHGQE